MKKAFIIIAIILLGLTVVSIPQKAEAYRVSALFTFPSYAKVKVTTSLNPWFLNILFSNLFLAKKVAYELTYERNGISEGVVGSFNAPVNGWKRLDMVARGILLGTCSSGGTCVPHTNLSNMKLKVTTTYKFFNVVDTVIYTIL